MSKEPPNTSNIPLAYLITVTCYGHRLHGDQEGSVDSEHNVYDTPTLPENPMTYEIKTSKMNHDPYELNDEKRETVHETIHEVCQHRDWILIVSHVRSTHVHTVLHACREPERVMNDIKSYASRRLNEAGFDQSNRKRWARHGSNKYLYALDSVQNAIRYTLHQQGEPMNVFLHDALAREQFSEYNTEINRRLRAFLQEQGIIDERGEVIIHD